ncbi:MAG: glycine cleavage system protein GcvH [Thaumarchaeota archaeon]|nr:glycine cleavage system protein GcvH [Nitrososphaerota archaeon]
MKEQHDVPEGLYYTREHEWARLESGAVVVGITDYAAKTLNDVVYLSLPSPGQDVKQLSTFGTVESIKAVSELYAPLSGKVTKVNSELANHPELVNQSPYKDGWIIEISASSLDQEKGKLLDSKQYAEFLASLEH